MKRLLGALLLVPLVAGIAIAAPTCERGRTMGMGGHSELFNNAITALIMLGVPAAIAGAILLFGKSSPKTDAPP
ncbi:MAG TPA: hypothetical protein VIF62_09395 [Labilithrix sp.]